MGFFIYIEFLIRGLGFFLYYFNVYNLFMSNRSCCTMFCARITMDDSYYEFIYTWSKVLFKLFFDLKDENIAQLSLFDSLNEIRGGLLWALFRLCKHEKIVGLLSFQVRYWLRNDVSSIAFLLFRIEATNYVKYSLIVMVKRFSRVLFYTFSGSRDTNLWKGTP